MVLNIKIHKLQKMLGNKDRTNINHALLGKTKTAYGFHWRYKNEL